MAAENWLLTSCCHLQVPGRHRDRPVILSVTELLISHNLNHGFNNVIFGGVLVSDGT